MTTDSPAPNQNDTSVNASSDAEESQKLQLQLQDEVATEETTAEQQGQIEKPKVSRESFFVVPPEGNGDASTDSLDEESVEESAQDDESPPEPADGEDTPTTNDRPGLVDRLKAIAAAHGKTAGISAASLLAGFGISWCLTPAPPAEVAQEASESETIKYVASIAHRNEPIVPLAPIEDLDPHIVHLGRRLFHDQALSGNGRVSCASCHDIAAGGDDGRTVPIGYEDQLGKLNAPTVFNSAFNYAQFWDGRAQSLEEQVDGPLLNPAEMNSDWDRITKYVSTNDSYSEVFEKRMGGAPNPDRIRTALATYERSLVTVDSRFDRWLKGDESALTTEELSGYYSFHKLKCITCHQGPNVGGTTFQPLGPMLEYFSSLRQLNEHDNGRFNATGDEEDRYWFRVPSLRNVEQTGPYFHDGSAKSLEDAVAIMIQYQARTEPNPEEVRRIALFLKALTGTLHEVPEPIEEPTKEGTEEA